MVSCSGQELVIQAPELRPEAAQHENAVGEDVGTHKAYPFPRAKPPRDVSKFELIGRGAHASVRIPVDEFTRVVFTRATWLGFAAALSCDPCAVTRVRHPKQHRDCAGL